MLPKGLRVVTLVGGVSALLGWGMAMDGWSTSAAVLVPLALVAALLPSTSHPK